MITAAWFSMRYLIRTAKLRRLELKIINAWSFYVAPAYLTFKLRSENDVLSRHVSELEEEYTVQRTNVRGEWTIALLRLSCPEAKFDYSTFVAVLP